MFETIKQFILAHESLAPWAIFFSILLAGLNFPISIDLMLILVAVLSATHLSHMKFSLFFALFFGSCISAWISYSLGRFIGGKIVHKFFSDSKLQKIKTYLHKYGTATLFIGRFIPFGFRNCLFMVSGLTKLSFPKFALIDSLACFIWCSTFFSIFFYLGESFEILSQHMKTINIVIASALGVTGITFICYKYRNYFFSIKNP